jgi:hypothetical protein
MKPIAKYSFTGVSIYNQRLKKHEHTGIDIPGFSQEWIYLFGTKYPHDDKRNNTSHGVQYTNLLDLMDGVTIGLNYVSEMPNFCYGSFGNDAILIKIERNYLGNAGKATIWFFQGMKYKSALLYDMWISCQLELD